MENFSDHPQYNRIDSTLDNMANVIKAKMPDFLAANGECFQGVQLLEANPDGTVDVDCDTRKCPSDKTKSWEDFDIGLFKALAKMPYNLRIDVYESPRGWGFVIVAGILYDGDNWIKRIHDGPDPSGILDMWYKELSEEY
jgi:hypothetical protein